MASYLTWILAEYPADTLAWLMCSVLEHDTKILCHKDTPAPDPKVLDLAAISRTSKQCTVQPVQVLLEKSTGLYWLGQGYLQGEQRARKERGSTMSELHSNDRGRFVQWFGGCNLITTLYV